MTSDSCFKHLCKQSCVGSAVSYKAKESSKWGRLEECRCIAYLKKFAKFKIFEVGYFIEQLFLTPVSEPCQRSKMELL